MARTWHAAHHDMKHVKAQRKARHLTKLPLIKLFCERHGVTIRHVEHGYQFLRGEYVLNWSPSTNKLSVQYRLPGHRRTIPFQTTGQPGKTKVLVALHELVQLV